MDMLVASSGSELLAPGWSWTDPADAGQLINYPIRIQYRPLTLKSGWKIAAMKTASYLFARQPNVMVQNARVETLMINIILL